MSAIYIFKLCSTPPPPPISLGTAPRLYIYIFAAGICTALFCQIFTFMFNLGGIKQILPSKFNILSGFENQHISLVMNLLQ
jgi:hypothetical protein